MGGILHENPRTIMNGVYSCIFDTNISGVHHVLPLGFYCVTITYSNLEYSRMFWLSRSAICDEP